MLNARKALGMTGFLLVLIHALMSFMLFSPAIFGKFFEADGSLTLLAGLSMLGGVLAFVVLWAYNLSFQTHLREDKAFIRFITSRTFLLDAVVFTGVTPAASSPEPQIGPIDFDPDGSCDPFDVVKHLTGDYAKKKLGL